MHFLNCTRFGSHVTPCPEVQIIENLVTVIVALLLLTVYAKVNPLQDREA
jgi:hypothetical protein